MKTGTVLSVISALFIFLGFGMVHNKNITLSTTGNIMIGIGSLYLIYQLYLSSKNSSDNNLD